MVNARQLEPVLAVGDVVGDPPLGKRVETTVKEMQVVSELGGGFETTTYWVLRRRGWVPLYGLVGAGCVEGIEVELADRDTGPGVPWRRWLRVKAPEGTAFRRTVRTPNREGARVDREAIPHDTRPFDLRMTRDGLRPPRAIVEETRRKAARAEPPAASADSRRHLEEILSRLGR